MIHWRNAITALCNTSANLVWILPQTYQDSKPLRLPFPRLNQVQSVVFQLQSQYDPCLSFPKLNSSLLLCPIFTDTISGPLLLFSPLLSPVCKWSPGMATHLHPLQCVSLSCSAANRSPQTLGDISLLRQVGADISLPASWRGGWEERDDCVGGGEAWTRSVWRQLVGKGEIFWGLQHWASLLVHISLSFSPTLWCVEGMNRWYSVFFLVHSFLKDKVSGRLIGPRVPCCVRPDFTWNCDFVIVVKWTGYFRMKLWRGKNKAVVGRKVNNQENGLQFYQRTTSE